MEKSIDNFTKIVPEVLRKLGKDSLIQFGIRLDDAPDLLTPDFILPAYNITLTYDKPFKDKAQSVYNPNLLKCERVSDGDHIYADYFYSDLFNIRFVDIKISDKTEEEWEETFRFVFDKLKYKMRWN
ncbi:MAG: hypothetical protein K5854_07660 [Prevotella sp.]|nr:hypothetical protein [Prevotella sp.]